MLLRRHDEAARYGRHSFLHMYAFLYLVRLHFWVQKSVPHSCSCIETTRQLVLPYTSSDEADQRSMRTFPLREDGMQDDA